MVNKFEFRTTNTSRFASETSLGHDYCIPLGQKSRNATVTTVCGGYYLLVVYLGSSAAKESDFRTAIIGSLRCGMSCRTTVKLTYRLECDEDTFRTLDECRHRVLRQTTCFVRDMSDVVKCINCIMRDRTTINFQRLSIHIIVCCMVTVVGITFGL